jgi:hypothetical protein
MENGPIWPNWLGMNCVVAMGAWQDPLGRDLGKFSPFKIITSACSLKIFNEFFQVFDHQVLVLG